MGGVGRLLAPVSSVTFLELVARVAIRRQRDPVASPIAALATR